VNSLLYGSFGKILPITSEAYLPADVAAGLTEFARTCKAAARAVSLYPDGHPAIAQSLARLADATERLTDRGPFALQVHADALLLDGARPQKPDLAVIELAGLLHRHLIGGVTVNSGAAADSWRTLLLLLSRPPEEVRADGGIAPCGPPPADQASISRKSTTPKYCARRKGWRRRSTRSSPPP
jgi:hypothetical protein